MLPTLVAAVALAAGAPGVDSAGCASGGVMHFACGIPVPEDLVRISGTRWVIASSMPRDGSAGGLYLVDTRTRAVHRIRLRSERTPPEAFASTPEEAAAVGHCLALDPQRFIAHGVSLSAGENGVDRLYVVGHGGREAIELFNVEMRGDEPVVRWAGCVEMPTGVEANSVVGLPGGGLMFTTLYDPGEMEWPQRIAKLASGAPSGGVFEWHAATGFHRLATPPLSGPNGIAVSPDGGTVFLAGWGDRIVRRLDRQGRETAMPLVLDFLPDNLHWAPDGSLLASGQATDVKSLFDCSAKKDRPTYCVSGWSVARIDPSKFAITANSHGVTSGSFGDTTTALQIDGRFWLGSINGDRIGIVDLNSEGAEKRAIQK